MPYNKEELLKLSATEKQELAEALWNSLEENAVPATEEELAFAEERFRQHTENPDEGILWDELKEKIKSKYGF